MKLLFIQGGSRLKRDIEGNWYTDGNLTYDVLNRYTQFCDELTIVLRKENKIYSINDAKSRFNQIPKGKNVKVIAVSDIMKPKWNFINPVMRNKVKNEIFAAVQIVDKVIIRSTSFLTEQAFYACIKYDKPYIVESTGFALESMSRQGIAGKILARHYEKFLKLMMRKAEGAIYVTEDALQKRYPCPQKMVGCSDVQLLPLDDNILVNRLTKVKTYNGREIVLGTAAFLDVAWKGQEVVIRSIAELKKKGLSNFVYELIGLGKGTRIIEIAKKLGVENQVKILGAKNHEDVFSWLDSIDIYIQPSYQEGLCRAIIEAMSRACPVVCSNIGGNYELISSEYLFSCGDSIQCAKKIEKIMSNLDVQAKMNFEHAKKYEADKLDKRRIDFMREFVYSK